MRLPETTVGVLPGAALVAKAVLAPVYAYEAISKKITAAKAAEEDIMAKKIYEEAKADARKNILPKVAAVAAAVGLIVLLVKGK